MWAVPDWRKLSIACLLVIIGVGAGLRVNAYRDYYREHPELEADAAAYADGARSIHIWKFLQSGDIRDLYFHRRYPAFPFLLAVVRAVITPEAKASYITSTVFGILMIPATFLLGLKIEGHGTALIGSLLVAINPSLYMNAAIGLTEEVYVVAILALFYIGLKMPESLLKIGLCTCIGSYIALLRGEGFIIPTVLAAYMVLRAYHSKEARRLTILFSYISVMGIPLLFFLMFQNVTHQWYAKAVGHFFHWHEFLRDKGIPFIEEPYRYTPISDYFFKYHTLSTLITHWFQGLWITLRHLDTMLFIPFSSVLLVWGSVLAIRRSAGLLPLTIAMAVPFPIFLIHGFPVFRLLYGYIPIACIILALPVTWLVSCAVRSGASQIQAGRV